MFANTNRMGQGSDGSPDVCVTPSPAAPPVPSPYPNIAAVSSTPTSDVVTTHLAGQAPENDPGAAAVPSQTRVVVFTP